MNAEEVAVHLAELESRGKSNTRRIDALEKNTEVLNKLATSVEVMALRQTQMADTLDHLNGEISDIKEKPAERWDAIITGIISTVVGFIVGAILSGAIG